MVPNHLESILKGIFHGLLLKACQVLHMSLVGRPVVTFKPRKISLPFTGADGSFLGGNCFTNTSVMGLPVV